MGATVMQTALSISTADAASAASIDHLSSEQIRGARGMLGWSMIELSKAAQVSLSTVQRVEEVQPQPVSNFLRAAIQGALEAAGVRFLPDDDDGIGLRLLTALPPNSGTGSA